VAAVVSALRLAVDACRPPGGNVWVVAGKDDDIKEDGGGGHGITSVNKQLDHCWQGA
jgi:hypothetical protein